MKSKRMKWTRDAETSVRNMRNAYIILFGKPEDERSLGRPRRR
jgi:hypothetical protein